MANLYGNLANCNFTPERGHDEVSCSPSYVCRRLFYISPQSHTSLSSSQAECRLHHDGEILHHANQPNFLGHSHVKEDNLYTCPHQNHEKVSDGDCPMSYMPQICYTGRTCVPPEHLPEKKPTRIKTAPQIFMVPEDKHLKSAWKSFTSNGGHAIPASSACESSETTIKAETISQQLEGERFGPDENLVIDFHFLVQSWACRTNLLSKIFCELEKSSFEGEKISVLHFNISLDLQEMIEFNGHLGSFVFRDPLCFFQILRQTCFDLLATQATSTQLFSACQIVLEPSFENVPSLPEVTISCCLDARRKLEGLVKIKGIVVSVSKAMQFTRSTRYECPQEDCVWSGDSCYLISASVGSVESDIVRSDFTCTACGSILLEKLACRTIADKQLAYLLPEDAVDCLGAANVHKRSESIRVLLKGKHVGKLDVGSCYCLTGIFRYDFRVHGVLATTQNFEVLSIEPTHPQLHHSPVFSYVPDSIRSLYHDRKASPWSFVASLAYCLSDSTVPPGLFHQLKLTLLMSLAMQGDESQLSKDEKLLNPSKINNNLHVLIVAEDLLVFQRILTFASSLSQTCILHRSPLDLFGCVTSDSDAYLVDGGSLSLAGSGVCYIPSLSQFKKETKEQLCKAFESGSISVDIPRKLCDQLQQTIYNLPFRCSVWACVEHERNLAKDCSVFPQALFSYFSVVIWEEECDAEDMIGSSLCQHILLRRSIKGKPGCIFDESDLRQFLQFVRSRRVELPDAVSNLLKAYYLVQRKLSQNSTPQSLLQTLTSMAAAHAKLRLQDVITLDDAIAAIVTLQQVCGVKSGESVIGVTPSIHLKDGDLSNTIGLQNDRRMEQIKRLIVQRCYSYYPALFSDLSLHEE